MLMPASTASRSMAASSSSVKSLLVGRGEVLLQLRHAARADEHRGHPRVAQRPGQRQLGQALAAGRRRSRPAPGRAPGRSEIWSDDSEPSRLAREPVGTPPRYLPVSTPWASGENAMQPTPSRLEHVEQAALDPAVQHRVRRLVDQQRRADLDGGWRLPPRSVRPNKKRCPRTAPCPTGPRNPARPSSPRAECPGRTGGSRRCRRTPGPSGAATGPGWPAGTCGSRVAVGAGPHVVAGLGRDDQLVAVRTQVLPHDPAEVDLGAEPYGGP
jgi:hypothetical protein